MTANNIASWPALAELRSAADRIAAEKACAAEVAERRRRQLLRVLQRDIATRLAEFTRATGFHVTGVAVLRPEARYAVAEDDDEFRVLGHADYGVTCEVASLEIVDLARGWSKCGPPPRCRR